VWLNPEGGRLVETLRALEASKASMASMLHRAGYAPSSYAVVTTEALFESEADASDAALERTVAAWSVALESLGVKPEPAKIKAFLVPWRGGRPAHALDAISNAAEVAAALASHPPYAQMIDSALLEDRVQRLED